MADKQLNLRYIRMGNKGKGSYIEKGLLKTPGLRSVADTHCSFALLKALCNPISPPSSNYWDWKAKYFQHSLKLAATKKHSLAQGTKKLCCRKGLTFQSSPHLHHLFLSKVLERDFGFLINYRYVVDSTFFHLHTSLCLEREHVMTGSTAAISLLSQDSVTGNSWV